MVDCLGLTIIFLESRIKLSFQVVDELGHPAVVLVVLLAIADEDVIFITRNDTCHDIILIK